MAKISSVKSVEITERIVSIQNEDAPFDHLIEIDSEKSEEYKNIQRDFMRMQSELDKLINS